VLPSHHLTQRLFYFTAIGANVRRQTNAGKENGKAQDWLSGSVGAELAVGWWRRWRPRAGVGPATVDFAEAEDQLAIAKTGDGRRLSRFVWSARFLGAYLPWQSDHRAEET